MEHLKAGGGTAVHLELDLERLKRRLGDVDARGVVIAPGQTVETLYAERRPLYRKYADLTVATDGQTPDQVVGRILSALNQDSA
jgi:shikimate kinase